MLDSEVLLPVVTQTLIKRSILLLGDVRRVACPQGLGLVEFFVLNGLLFNLLRLLLLGPVLFVFDFLDLGLVFISILVLLHRCLRFLIFNLL